MIYIDPPYNTGNDFIYNDKFVIDSDDYEEESGAVDELGNRLLLIVKIVVGIILIGAQCFSLVLSWRIIY